MPLPMYFVTAERYRAEAARLRLEARRYPVGDGRHTFALREARILLGAARRIVALGPPLSMRRDMARMDPDYRYAEAAGFRREQRWGE